MTDQVEEKQVIEEVKVEETVKSELMEEVKIEEAIQPEVVIEEVKVEEAVKSESIEEAKTEEIKEPKVEEKKNKYFDWITPEVYNFTNTFIKEVLHSPDRAKKIEGHTIKDIVDAKYVMYAEKAQYEHDNKVIAEKVKLLDALKVIDAAYLEAVQVIEDTRNADLVEKGFFFKSIDAWISDIFKDMDSTANDISLLDKAQKEMLMPKQDDVHAEKAAEEPVAPSVNIPTEVDTTIPPVEEAKVEESVPAPVVEEQPAVGETLPEHVDL